MISEAIRRRREELGLTVARAAALAGYHVKSWYNWEAGDQPKPETILRIARVLQCSVAEFTNGSIRPAEASEHPVGSVAWERAESMKRQAERTIR